MSYYHSHDLVVENIVSWTLCKILLVTQIIQCSLLFSQILFPYSLLLFAMNILFFLLLLFPEPSPCILGNLCGRIGFCLAALFFHRIIFVFAKNDSTSHALIFRKDVSFSSFDSPSMCGTCKTKNGIFKGRLRKGIHSGTKFRVAYF